MDDLLETWTENWKPGFCPNLSRAKQERKFMQPIAESAKYEMGSIYNMIYQCSDLPSSSPISVACCKQTKQCPEIHHADWESAEKNQSRLNFLKGKAFLDLLVTLGTIQGLMGCFFSNKKKPSYFHKWVILWPALDKDSGIGSANDRGVTIIESNAS